MFQNLINKMCYHPRFNFNVFSINKMCPVVKLYVCIYLFSLFKSQKLKPSIKVIVSNPAFRSKIFKLSSDPEKTKHGTTLGGGGGGGGCSIEPIQEVIIRTW